MLLSLASFIAGLCLHVGRAVTFTADGAGLPTKPSAVFYLLIVMGMAAAGVRHGIYGPMTFVTAALGFLATATLFSFLFTSQRFQCFSVYLCLSAGIDMIAVLGHIAEADVASWPMGIWEFVGILVACFRFERRMKAEGKH